MRRANTGTRRGRGSRVTTHRVRAYAMNPSETSLRVLGDVDAFERLVGGLEWGRRRASGYVRTVRRDRLQMAVRAPARGRYRALVAGRPVRSARAGRDVVFTLPVRPGRAARWSIASARSRR
jgi:hypothetical protein